MKKIQFFVIAVFTLLYGSQGMAGSSIDSPVLIDLDNKNAQGAQSSARFADNDVEVIGCGTTIRDDGVNPPFSFGFCQATDANGVSVLCVTLSAELSTAINGIANYGFISFQWNDDQECVSVRNSTQSIYIPDFRSDKSQKPKN